MCSFHGYQLLFGHKGSAIVVVVVVVVVGFVVFIVVVVVVVVIDNQTRLKTMMETNTAPGFQTKAKYFQLRMAFKSFKLLIVVTKFLNSKIKTN